MKIVNLPSSVRVAVVLTALIAGACVVATFLAQPVADRYVYYSWWFLALVGLFTLNLLACTVFKARMGRRAPGFLASHAGVLLVIAGAVVSGIWCEAGYAVVPEGGTVTTFHEEVRTCMMCGGMGFVRMTRDGDPVSCPGCGGMGVKLAGWEKPLDFELLLRDFQIEYYPHEPGEEPRVKSYTSEVTARSGKETREAQIKVNHPLSYGGYKIYQADYDHHAGRWSLFQVR